MNKLEIEILPGIGLRSIRFGSSKELVEKVLGQPDERDLIDSEEDILEQALVYHYWDHYLSVFFAGENQDCVVAFETDHLDATLFEQKIFKLTDKQVIDLLKEKRVFEFETEEEPWGEKRLTIGTLGMDLYYEDKQLETLNWSAWYDQNGKMVFPDVES